MNCYASRLLNPDYDRSRLVIVKDTLENASLHLLYHLISSWSMSCSPNALTILHNEKISQAYLNRCRFSQKKNLFFIDLFSNPYGWEANDDTCQLSSDSPAAIRSIPCTQVNDLNAVYEAIVQVSLHAQKSILVIDSLSSLLLHGHHMESLAIFLNQLKQSKDSLFQSIFVIWHADTVDQRKCERQQLLEAQATDIITMDKPALLTSILVKGSFKILRKDKKVRRYFEHYGYVSDLDVLKFYSNEQVFSSVKINAAESQSTMQIGQDDIDRPTDEQVRARRAVQLPYANAKKYASQSISGLPELSLDEQQDTSLYDVEADELEDEI
ncbi:uncharacterized protein LOC126316715 [Schistocerca gregaria]|uniref:uncharacterized protein LOC126316715 n=1 Tax=Schistocerca gregaria TaxID=7010 RepID=UPI00211DD9DC|nr:uncharacterized protein LOC126316715 [Schistocerca gregaria]